MGMKYNRWKNDLHQTAILNVTVRYFPVPVPLKTLPSEVKSEMEKIPSTMKYEELYYKGALDRLLSEGKDLVLTPDKSSVICTESWYKTSEKIRQDWLNFLTLPGAIDLLNKPLSSPDDIVNDEETYN